MARLLPIDVLKVENAVFIHHYRERRLLVQFVYRPGNSGEIISFIKSFGRYYYHAKAQYWSIEYAEDTVSKLKSFFSEKGFKVIYKAYQFAAEKQKPGIKERIETDKKLTEAQKKALQEMRKTMVVARYSEKTVKAYLGEMKELFYHYAAKHPDRIDAQMVREYVIKRVEEDGISASKQQMMVNGIRYYFKNISGKDPEPFVALRPKVAKTLPEVMSKEEVLAVFESVSNIKHKCILMIIYSGGLRISEATHLRVSDILFDTRMINIRGGKGKKDRQTLLSSKLLPLLNRYIDEYEPAEWLFEGEQGSRYSERSIRHIFRRAVKNAGIKRKVTVHTLRHSFATHLLEQGVDIRYIQKLLGHESIATTEIYTHITKRGIENLKSPLDGW